MSMPTIAFVAHALRPSTTSDTPSNLERNQESPRTVTGNSYFIFTTKNYEDNEMHWFWMVLVCALLLFAWWKLRCYCRCPGPSKEDRRERREARWHKRQLDEIEKQIEKYERKLEDIKNLRSSLDLDHGANSSALGFSNAVDQNSGAWICSWPVSIFPSQGATACWHSPTEEQSLMYDMPDWYERNSPERQWTGWNTANQGIWTPPHGLTPTAQKSRTGRSSQM